MAVAREAKEAGSCLWWQWRRSRGDAGVWVTIFRAKLSHAKALRYRESVSVGPVEVLVDRSSSYDGVRVHGWVWLG